MCCRTALHEIDSVAENIPTRCLDVQARPFGNAMETDAADMDVVISKRGSP
jgi:hypothetical protein